MAMFDSTLECYNCPVAMTNPSDCINTTACEPNMVKLQKKGFAFSHHQFQSVLTCDMLNYVVLL